jgi:maltose alpha-D-glucosyltransferase/alpha-amylase
MIAIAIIHEFVVNQGDAWTVTAAYLDRFVDEQRLLTTDENRARSEEQIPYLRYMSQCGRRVAEMHMALARDAGLADFTPEATRPEDVQRWIDGIMARAERVFETLAHSRDTIREADRPLVDQLQAQRATLPERLKALLPRDIDILNIRHHGDFHLGQMLIVKDDIFIIDFEGEPRRPHAERRRKAPAARDVAGLIRSIDYSATAALERALKVGPDEQAKLSSALAAWRDRSTETFLAAYREAMTHPRLWPADRQDATRMLNFFLLEKAFYEIEYELAHRPDWLRVPLTGMLRILSQETDEA